MVDPNTRQGKRTPVTLKIKFKSETLEQFIERYAVDVSQGGIFIRTKEPLAVGTQMKFEFQLRDASPLIAGEGTVVWTRENDPSRPAIAPGMGVRFDRLADGSQGILERILAEKAKQAPQRPTADTTKPPLFTDTPTRVAPAPMQDALLGKNNGQRGGREDTPHGDSHTPLPKPIPFHSDADEFPDEAFEEATKVRALDELIAQTAEGGGQDELAVRRPNGRPEAARAESAMDRAETRPLGEGPEPLDLPTPPELGALGRPPPKMLDTSPSPRIDPPMGSPLGSSLPAAESPAKTRLGLEPARARVSTPPSYPPPLSLPLDPQGPQGPSIGHAILESSSMSSSMSSGMRALPAEQTQPARLPPIRPRSSAPIVILLLLLVAAAGAAVWFLVLRPQTTADPPEHVTGSSQSGSATAPGAVATGTATPGSAAAPVGSGAPAEIAETVISAGVEGARVEIAGAGQTGPAPFTARLEKGKSYKARISAHGYATLEVDIKGGDPNRSATLIAKPRVLSIDSDPSGAVILVDNATTGHTTPFDIELTAAQGQKKSIRLQLRKSGYRASDRTVDLGKLTEEDTRMIAKLSEKLAPAPPITRTGSNAGTGKGSDTAGTGSDTAAPANGSAESSGSSPGPVMSPSGGTGTPPPPPPSGATNGSSGSAAEPEPDFTKPKN